MPVAIGNELKLENNKVSAYYDNLFRKLNVAKAWTNTQITESGGTVTVLYDFQIMSNLECSNINGFYVPFQFSTWNKNCIIDGKLYTCYNGSLHQIGSDTNWKCCTNSSRVNQSQDIIAINNDGKLYRITNVNRETGVYTDITQLGNNTNWTQITCTTDYGPERCYGIENGKLYHIYGSTLTQIGTDTSWTKVLNIFAINNGLIYTLSKTDASVQLLSMKNDFVDIFSNSDLGVLLYAVDSAGKLYVYYNNSMMEVADTPSGIKKVYPTTGSYNSISILTTNGELYVSTDSSISIVDNKVKINLYKLNSSIYWNDVIGPGVPLIGIGNGKLYKVSKNNNEYIYEIIGNNSNYKKIEGTTSTYGMALAWTGDATYTETTVYTTKNPITNDKVYSDTNLTEYSTVQSCNGSTMTDNYRTYNLDISKNSSFTKIPPATLHETVSVADILRATE